MDYKTILLKQNRCLFHTSDLALLWNISNKNTLYTTIKRYTQKGILNRIHKGFYATKPISQIDPIVLALSYIHTYAYVSTEYVLSKSGIINQYTPTITLVSSKPNKFSLANRNFIVRSMKPEFLYNDAGIQTEAKGYKIATPERAVCDMLYYNKNAYFDNPTRFDNNLVFQIRKEVGFV